jgi:aminopeptidase N
MANFDAISYSKGQAVLKQLGAYVGEDALLEGLRAYFRDHAWGNTTLEDFVGAVAAASGRDLGEWQRSWLDEGGTDTLTLSGSELTATGPDGKAPRPHRVDIGCYVDEGSSLSKVADVAVQTVGGSTQVELPESDLRLVNDGDLTFAAARTDPASLDLLLRKAGLLPDAVSRSLAVSTVYDMLLKGELGAEETLACILGVLETEHVAGIVEPFLQIASTVAHRYMPLPRIESARSRVADVAAVLAGQPELAKGALLELAGNAVTAEHFARVDSAASSDFGLAWRVATTRAAQGDYEEAVIEDLLERDPDPDAPFSALAVRTARPLAEAKEEAWHALYVEQNVPSGLAMYPMVQAFWQPEQRDVVLPYTWRYLEEVPKLAGGLMLKVGGLIRGMFPDVGDQAFIDAALEMARADGCDPTVRGALLNGTDGLVRKLRARGDLPAG